MVDGNSGKGDRPRPFNRKKWDKGWEPLEKERDKDDKNRNDISCDRDT